MTARNKCDLPVPAAPVKKIFSPFTMRSRTSCCCGERGGVSSSTFSSAEDHRPFFMTGSSSSSDRVTSDLFAVRGFFFFPVTISAVERPPNSGLTPSLRLWDFNQPCCQHCKSLRLTHRSRKMCRESAPVGPWKVLRLPTRLLPVRVHSRLPPDDNSRIAWFIARHGARVPSADSRETGPRPSVVSWDDARW